MAAASRWRSVVSSSTLRTNQPNSLPVCRQYSGNSDSSNGNNRDESGGIPSLSGLKRSLKDIQSNPKTPTEQNDPKTKASSLFEEVRASIRNPNPQRKPPSQAFTGTTPKVVSLEEIRKNLSEFRMKSEPPGPRKFPQFDARKSSASGPSFQASNEGNAGNSNQGNKEVLSFESIRDSLRQLRSNTPHKSKAGNESLGSFSLKAFGESLRLQPEGRGSPLKPSDSRPSSVFGREKAGGDSRPPKTEFMKMYSYDELGAKLRNLRPDVEEQKKKGFSLNELNDRLQKLREIEEEESESNIGGLSFKDLRESLFQLRVATENSNKKSSLQRLAFLGQLGGQAIPPYMISPPKDELVQRYFHPNNMSAEEKLKIELNKVKDQFKMHEADCGSSSVQVAQLTTKIKYLAQVLHKKDKHSRKGLQQMIQRRKKLLKYLRRTDWDSYCFVISKLGLRDNPDYKT